MAVVLQQQEGRLSEVGGIMSLDGQVLVIALFAVALKLFLWSKGDAVVVDVELNRKDVLHHRFEGDRYV
jgi:hypothetical protein